MVAFAPTAPVEKYQPIFELGRGGMATVFLAVVRGPGGFNKLQVIKQLRAELAADPDFLTMFIDEARLSARINHPNVVQTNEVGFDGKHYFIAMEYLEGQSLENFNRRAQRQQQAMALPMYLRILVDALRGLHHAHELKSFDGKALNVVHRDVSPHNIFVTYNGQVKVVDFGIAKAADSNHETRIGILKGKVAYMAPEQVGSKMVDRRTDVFAMGMILWHALTDTRPWKGLNEMDILLRLTNGDIPSPRTVRPDLPERLVDICMKSLSVDPTNRYGSAADFGADLERYLDEIGDRTTMHDVGKHLASLFEDRRSEVAAALEKRLGALDSMEEVPALFPTAPESLSDPSQPARSHSGSGSLAVRSLGTDGSSASAPAAAPSTANRKWLPIAVAAGGVLIAGVLAVRLSAGRHDVAQAAVDPAHAGASAADSARSSSLVSQLRIKVTPTDANILVDEHPFSMTDKFPQDKVMHRVRAEAPGYAAQTALVAFDTEIVELSLNLEKQKLPAAAAGYRPSMPGPRRPRGSGGGADNQTDSTPPPATPAPAVASPPEPGGVGVRKPPQPDGKPTLDTSDPWKRQ